MKDKLKEFERLLNIMDELREKCPWDMKQTIKSIRHLTIEEIYELSDAIMNNDMEEIKKELGDVLLHIVFYSRIASETNEFDIKDVMASLCEKLIRRHPHIYGDVKVTSEEDVKRNWEKIKQTEGKKKTSVLSGVPKSMPSLIKATRIQEKARGVGFDWDRKYWCNRRKRVLNKHARANVCFGSTSCEPDYENKKGRMVTHSILNGKKI